MQYNKHLLQGIAYLEHMEVVLLTHSISLPSLPCPSLLPSTLVHSMSCTLVRPQLLGSARAHHHALQSALPSWICPLQHLLKQVACQGNHKARAEAGRGQRLRGGGGGVPVDTIQYAEKLIRGCNENLIIAIRGHSMHTKPRMTPCSPPFLLLPWLLSTVAINLQRRVAACNTRSSTTSSQVK